jgi:hypothetical protein
MISAIGIYDSLDLITRWWEPLQNAGFEVEIQPSLDKEGTPEKDSIVYRQGSVSRRGVKVGIITTNALCPFSKNNSLSGKPALFIQYGGFCKKTRIKRLELAEEILELFVRKGAKLLGKPSDYKLGK